MKNYKSKLVKEMNRHTRRIIIIFLVIFTVSIIVGTLITQKLNVDKVHAKYVNILDDVYDHFEDFLDFNRFNENFISFMEDGSNIEGVYQAYYRFHAGSRIACDLVLSDANANILFTTKGKDSNTKFLKSDIDLKSEKVSSSKPYTTNVVRSSEGVTRLVLTTGIYKKDQFVGYASYYYDNVAFNYELTSYQFNGAMIDRFGNVIATSSPKFVSGYLKRLSKGYDRDGIIQDEASNFLRIATFKYKNDITIVAIVPMSEYYTLYMVGIIFMVVFSLAAFIVSKHYVNLLANNNTASIEKLVEQMEIIKKGDFDHRIVIDTKDEFESLSEDLNIMVDAIKTITNKNSELYYKSKISEIKQLEAQFNPHFLYNTLETIRYAIVFDTKAAEDLILKLTKILRYSIDNEKGQVYFIDDLEEIKQYLDIQKYRLKDRLEIIFEIDEACKNERIPRLMIEPLIENSIQNGYRLRDHLHILVKAYIKDRTMFVIVEDDGSGIEKEELDRINANLQEPFNTTNHNGLFNINRRIYLMYGPGSSLHLESEVTKGTTAIIKIELESGDIHV